MSTSAGDNTQLSSLLRAWRWRIAIMLCLITTINYVDRLVFSVATPTLRDVFSFSNADIGTLSLAFLLAYGIGQILAGRIVDRYGVKRVFSIAVVVWSIAGIAHAWGQGIKSFITARVFLGIGEAINFPAVFKSVAEWFPREERALAVGVVTLGVGFGSIITPPLVGWLIIDYSWQVAFIVPGLLGFLWLAVWWRYYETPDVHRFLQASELDFIRAGQDTVTDSPRPAWSALLGQRTTWALMLSRFVADGAFYFILFWLPLYLADARGLDLRAIAMFAWLPYLFADIGSFAGGWASSLLVKRGWSVGKARRSMIWLGAVGATAALPAALTGNLALCIALICLTMFFIQFKQANLFTLPSDLFSPRDVATIWGVFGAAGSLGAALFQKWTGFLIDSISYTPVFVLVAGMHLLSALVISTLLPRFSDHTSGKP
ncbi:MAG: MFS transporter [Pseudomonadota bacterium]